MDAAEYRQRMLMADLMADVESQDDDEQVVNNPEHYAQYDIEPKDFIIRNGFEFWRGNIVKYACRAGSKRYDGLDKRQSEIRDLKKSIRYAEMRINQLNGNYNL